MNLSDSLIFAALGTAMETLPKIFPSWFPHGGTDLASNRALWLEFMGAVQIALGSAAVLATHVLPLLRRGLSIAPTGEPAMAPENAIRSLTAR
jgi:hypothetical protein